jgi:hypothetical protein
MYLREWVPSAATDEAELNNAGQAMGRGEEIRTPNPTRDEHDQTSPQITLFHAGNEFHLPRNSSCKSGIDNHALHV